MWKFWFILLKILKNYPRVFNKIFSLTFTITLIHTTIFLKFCAEIFLCFFTVSQSFFFNLTKIMRHSFYKTYKIFEKFEVLRTFSISSLMFLLKLASHYKKLQNMSQVFHPQWETIDLQFLSLSSCRTSDLFQTCLWTIAEVCLQTQVRDFVYKCACTKPKIGLAWKNLLEFWFFSSLSLKLISKSSPKISLFWPVRFSLHSSVESKKFLLLTCVAAAIGRT